MSKLISNKSFESCGSCGGLILPIQSSTKGCGLDIHCGPLDGASVLASGGQVAAPPRLWETKPHHNVDSHLPHLRQQIDHNLRGEVVLQQQHLSFK